MNELITALGFAWRTIDGRSFAPNYWNVYIYLGLLTILCGYVYLEYMTALQAFGIYAVVLTYILSGYKSMTTYWVQHLLGYMSKEMYEAKDKGFASWHMSYRYVIAGCMICAILDTWPISYLIACSVAGLLFPLRVRYWNTEASARLTEGILGAVIIGGWAWLV